MRIDEFIIKLGDGHLNQKKSEIKFYWKLNLIRNYSLQKIWNSIISVLKIKELKITCIKRENNNKIS